MQPHAAPLRVLIADDHSLFAEALTLTEASSVASSPLRACPATCNRLSACSGLPAQRLLAAEYFKAIFTVASLRRAPTRPQPAPRAPQRGERLRALAARATRGLLAFQ
jgi:hypothetical protein